MCSPPVPFFILIGSPTCVLGTEEGGSFRKSLPPVKGVLPSPSLVSLLVCSTGDKQALLLLFPNQHPCGGLRRKGEGLKTQYSPHPTRKYFGISSPAPCLDLTSWLLPRLEICPLTCKELRSYSCYKQSKLDIPKRWACPSRGRGDSESSRSISQEVLKQSWVPQEQEGGVPAG